MAGHKPIQQGIMIQAKDRLGVGILPVWSLSFSPYSERQSPAPPDMARGGGQQQEMGGGYFSHPSPPQCPWQPPPSPLAPARLGSGNRAIPVLVPLAPGGQGLLQWLVPRGLPILPTPLQAVLSCHPKNPPSSQDLS